MLFLLIVIIIVALAVYFRESGVGRAPLRAQDFMANNPEHLELLKRMGVTLIHLKDGRVQLVQHATQVYQPVRLSVHQTCSHSQRSRKFRVGCPSVGHHQKYTHSSLERKYRYRC